MPIRNYSSFCGGSERVDFQGEWGSAAGTSVWGLRFRVESKNGRSCFRRGESRLGWMVFETVLGLMRVLS
jgi:hypothetical protein